MTATEATKPVMYWLSTKKMTFGAYFKDGYVMDAAPIARKFIGQPAKNLLDWMRKQEGFKARRID